MKVIIMILIFLINISSAQNIFCKNSCTFNKGISFFTEEDSVFTDETLLNKSDQALILKIASPKIKSPQVIDVYLLEGNMEPQLQNVFSSSIGQKKYIFVISKFRVYHPSIGTEGWAYTVTPYSYEKNIFIKNDKYILAGIDGLDEFQKVSFPYKTKEQVIEYFDNVGLLNDR